MQRKIKTIWLVHFRNMEPENECDLLYRYIKELYCVGEISSR